MRPALSTEWQAVAREAELSAQLIASGVTALGRANYAQKGYYSQAFFGLSIGLERLCKLVIVAEHAVTNDGRFPSNSDLRLIGHNLAALINCCDDVSRRQRSDQYSDRPALPVHEAIIQNLTEFAQGTRYYNLNYITGQAAIREPTSAWWELVAQPILAMHYSPRRRARDEAAANLTAELVEHYGSVMHHSEEGSAMTSIADLMRRSGATQVVQRYGRLYTLQIVRWLSCLADHLGHLGAYEVRIEPLLALTETFWMFMQPDSMLRSRKTWSPYP